jgi:hypothetical protein
MFSARMKSTSVRKTWLLIKSKSISGSIQDRRLCADGFIVRAQSAIRAAGPPAAQARATLLGILCHVGHDCRSAIARSARQP